MEDYTKWPKEKLMDEAFRLLTRANELLDGIEKRSTALVKRLKETPYDDLSLADKQLLFAQLAHEKKAKALGWI